MENLNSIPKADLHIHTIFSDGSVSPSEIVQQGANLKLRALGITDHDCVEGINPALEAGVRFGVEIIPGVELSSAIGETEVHILGYYIDWRDQVFRQQLGKMQDFRQQRLEEMVFKLRGIGLPLDLNRVREIAGNGAVGRLHLAQALQEAGYISGYADAFSRYLGIGKPAYVGKFPLSPKQAIEMILSVKGIPVLAHPASLKRDELIPEFIEYGLKGIEAYHPDCPPSLSLHYEELVRKYNLVVTGGSDYHGPAKPNVYLGKVVVPYTVVEKLKALQVPSVISQSR